MNTSPSRNRRLEVLVKRALRDAALREHLPDYLAAVRENWYSAGARYRRASLLTFAIIGVFLLIMGGDVSEVSVLGATVADARVFVVFLPAAVAYFHFAVTHIGSEIIYYRSVHHALIKEAFPVLTENQLEGALEMATIPYETVSLYPYVEASHLHKVLVRVQGLVISAAPLGFLIYAHLRLHSEFGMSLPLGGSLAFAVVCEIRKVDTWLNERVWLITTWPRDTFDRIHEPFRSWLLELIDLEDDEYEDARKDEGDAPSNRLGPQ